MAATEEQLLQIKNDLKSQLEAELLNELNDRIDLQNNALNSELIK